MEKPCLRCGQPTDARRRGICATCSAFIRRRDESERGKDVASSKVSQAVYKGQLPQLKEVWVKCTICDNRATAYDHRDYNKPLGVSPVCGSCNCHLRMAKPIDGYTPSHWMRVLMVLRRLKCERVPVGRPRKAKQASAA